jgi:uncharacterized protein DUF6941
MQASMFLCRYAERREDGTFNALGGGISDLWVTDDVGAGIMVYLLAQVTRTIGDGGRHEAEIEIRGADGEHAVPPIRTWFSFEERGGQRVTAIYDVHGLQRGSYDFVLRVDNMERARCDLRVHHRERLPTES